MLKWKKWGEYALISECGKYSIAKTGPADDYVYHVFRLVGYNKKTDYHKSEALLTFRSAAEAKIYVQELEKINESVSNNRANSN